MKRAALCLSAAALAGCANSIGEPDIAGRAQAAFAAAFAGGDAQILARVEHQDEAQRLCSEHRNAPPLEVAHMIERAQRAAIRYPASGRLMGDWRQGKAIAEDTSGMRYGDPAGRRTAATATHATSSLRRKSPTARSARACSATARREGRAKRCSA